ncbi:hypothetical protein [Anaeromyxobacter oryzae]|uniref:Lipoprotein n=1 Tax=Anaeromyxobacter oryzae TaxID=2918170 RepID=A0ABN6N0E2_9BACT|nr:hypothetical protein [Anaeromyxobacter oryzae]BDG05448.1 hypothetical protein AMOR_44440 [Anaeromyxobacter oryzae]
MRLAVLAAVLLASCAAVPAPRPTPPSVPMSDRPILGPLQTALLYHQQTATPAPDDRLVSWYGEVCGELDPAARRAAAERARASLSQASAEAAATARWLVPVSQALGGYDLAVGGFPTSLHEGAVVRFGTGDYCNEELGYLVVFKNGGAFSSVAVPREQALEFVRTNPARRVVHELEVEVVGAQAAPAPALVVNIVALRTRDAVTGSVLAESRGVRRRVAAAAAHSPAP